MNFTPQRIASLGSLLAVPTLVIGVRMAGGLGAASASAGAEFEEPIETRLGNPIAQRPREPQAAAAAWYDQQDPTGPLTSPMKVEPVAQAPVVEAGDPRAVPASDGLPALRLTGVMATRAGGIATINGTVLRLGDRVAPGWTLTAVDVQNAAVELTRFDGTVRRVAQPR